MNLMMLLEMASQGLPVAACGGPGQGGGGSYLPNVVERGLHERPEGLGWDSDLVGQLLYLVAERSEVIGGNGGGCVISGSLFGRHSSRSSAEVSDHVLHENVAIDGKSAVVEQAGRTHHWVGQRHQRMDGANALVRLEFSERARTGAVRNHRWSGGKVASHGCDLIVRCGDEHEVGNAGDIGERVGPPPDRCVPSNLCQGSCERTTGPSVADHYATPIGGGWLLHVFEAIG